MKPEEPRSTREAWDLAAEAYDYCRFSLERIDLVHQFLQNKWTEDSQVRDRLMATEKFLMSEGYRRLDLQGNWTREPIDEAS